MRRETDREEKDEDRDEKDRDRKNRHLSVSDFVTEIVVSYAKEQCYLFKPEKCRCEWAGAENLMKHHISKSLFKWTKNLLVPSHIFVGI